MTAFAARQSGDSPCRWHALRATVQGRLHSSAAFPPFAAAEYLSGGVAPPGLVTLALTDDCPLAVTLASRMRDSRDELTHRWLERIAARVSITPDRIFPTDALLDHIPLLVSGIADYVENPAREVAAEAPVLAKAMELGALRWSQRFDAYQIQKEYEILGGILFAFLAREVETLREPCTRSELLVCAHRLFHAVSIIQQATTTQYLQRAAERVREREERLRAFNRALTHEFKNQLHAVRGAVDVLELPSLNEGDRDRILGSVRNTVETMANRLDGLLELTRLAEDARQQRHVLLPEAAMEAARQLRESAETSGVTLDVSPSLPQVEVPAAAVELCLVNYISNAIKYADPDRVDRWVRVSAELRTTDDGGPELVVRVQDNGLGVPPPRRVRLFERFARVHDRDVTGVEGTGLGLSIVRDTVEAMGGHAWAEFPESGSVFAFSLPSRRAADGGTERSEGSAAARHAETGRRERAE